jgi:signal transduction histidine kinase/CheY-like chemotaxis protein
VTPDEDLNGTLEHISVLYELALASGSSLDLTETCRSFLGALASRKGFAYTAVWLRSDVLPSAGGGGPGPADLRLVYGAPRVVQRERSLPLDHPLYGRVVRDGPFSVGSSQEAFASFVTEQDVHQGMFAVFPLARLGLLKIYRRKRTVPLTPVELARLDTVVRKFASSLEGCVAHERLRLAVSERERVEKEKEAMQRRLQQAEKMEAVGRLAGGVAHDFNNLLVGVLGTVELLLLDEEDPATRSDLEVIAQAGQRAAELTQQLLAFARTNQEQVVTVRPDLIVAEVVGLLQRTLVAGIEVRTDLGVGDLCVRGVPSQLHTALLNLAVNARDAMPDGGVLAFATSVATAPFGALGTEPWIRLTVSDSGHGMPPDVAAKAFEPFFTTKPAGEGTGLGLATVYGIVTSHGGEIEVSSAPGQGTTFEILLPTCDPCSSDKAVRDEGGARSEAGGWVLLVEDGAGPRRTGTRLLERLGYQVLEAEDGPTALRRAMEHPAELRAAVIDLQMPHMDGVEALRRLRVLRPELPAVMVSGYPQPHHLDALARLGVRGVLRKPYSLQDLAGALDDVAGVPRSIAAAPRR